MGSQLDVRQDDGNGPNGGSPLEVGRRLARLVVSKMLVPLIVAGLLDLDEAIQLIKRGVVAALADIRKPNQLIADHLSRSRRWFQDHLKQVREEQRRSLEAGSAQEGAEESDLDETGHGYKLMLEVLLALSTVYPDAVGIEKLRTLADMPSWHMSNEELASRLEFYQHLGVLQISGYDSHGPVVRAVQRVPKDLPRPEQLERVGEWLRWVFPLALAHCEGQGDFGGIYAELSPQALKRARKKLKEAAADIIAEAVAETHKSDEPVESDVKVRVIIAIGAAGGLDEQR